MSAIKAKSSETAVSIWTSLPERDEIFNYETISYHDREYGGAKALETRAGS